MPRYFVKQPNETHDYQFDWEDWLEPTNGDTIASATVTSSPTGLTLGSQTTNATNVIQFVSGGTDGVDYTVTCRMSTNQGRVDEEEIFIQVREF